MTEIPEHLLKRAEEAKARAAGRPIPPAEPAPTPPPRPQSSEPERELPDGFSNVKLGRHRFWAVLLLNILYVVPMALIVALAAWFFLTVIFGVGDIAYLAYVRWIYLGGLAIITCLDCIAMFGRWTHARQLEVPIKAMSVAICKYKLHKEPGFKGWTREELLSHIQVAAGIRSMWGRPLPRPRP